MKYKRSDLTKEYFCIQEKLSKQVITEDSFKLINYIAGVDVGYEKDGDKVIAAITILECKTLDLVETATHVEKVSFPYIAGLFSFREIPPILKAYDKLNIRPDLAVCDGQGYAHPRRFGLACHFGVELDIPSIGCAKSRLIGNYESPSLQRGSYSNLFDNGMKIGRVLRTQDNVKPVFVSIGHKISLESATNWILKLCPKYRLPETTRTADHAVKVAMHEMK